jgi:hypothetical protein
MARLEINTDIPGWTKRYDLVLMSYMASKLTDDQKITEIGAWCGRSTWAFLHNSSSGVAIDVVDPFLKPDVHSTAWQEKWLTTLGGSQENLERLCDEQHDSLPWRRHFDHFVGQNLRITVHETVSTEATGLYPEHTMIAFIDGLHTSGMPYHDMSLFIENEQCLIIMDDWFNFQFPDVSRAVEYAKSRFYRSIWVPPFGQCAWVLPKNGPLLAHCAHVIGRTMGHPNPKNIENVL